MKKFIMGYVFGIIMCMVSLYVVGVMWEKYGVIEVEMVVEEVYEGDKFVEIDND